MNTMNQLLELFSLALVKNMRQEAQSDLDLLLKFCNIS